MNDHLYFRTNTKLDIFENFETDFNLSKHKGTVNDKDQVTFLDFDSEEEGSVPNMPMSDTKPGVFFSGDMGSVMSGFASNSSLRKKPKFINKLFIQIKYFFTRSKIKIMSVPVQKVFNDLAKNIEELRIVNTRLDGYKKLLIKAQTLGQKALEEKVKDHIKLYYLETALLKSEFKKFITEEKIILFSKKCERGLRLDWIKNFTRVIPDDVLEQKLLADELNVFDNYVILHFDPKNENNHLTKKEIEKKKDPILFGVIRGSRKLYFIGDWIDEVCDLTWEKIAELLGDELVDFEIKETVENENDL